MKGFISYLHPYINMPFNSKEKQKEYDKMRYIRDKVKIKETQNKYFKINKEAYITKRKEWRHRMKNAVYLKLTDGNIKCMNSECLIPGGCKDIRALQIDHIKGGGTKERTDKSFTYYKFYNKLLTLPLEELKENYQVLCANCNMIKKDYSPIP